MSANDCELRKVGTMPVVGEDEVRKQIMLYGHCYLYKCRAEHYHLLSPFQTFYLYGDLTNQPAASDQTHSKCPGP